MTGKHLKQYEKTPLITGQKTVDFARVCRYRSIRVILVYRLIPHRLISTIFLRPGEHNFHESRTDNVRTQSRYKPKL